MATSGVIAIGSNVKHRGTYNSTTEYYTSNEVTLYGSVFRATSNSFSGKAPLSVDSSGKVSLANTSYWTCIIDNTELYNAALSTNNLESRIETIENNIDSVSAYAESAAQSAKEATEAAESVKSSVSDEAKAREAADKTLQDNIDAITETFGAADGIATLDENGRLADTQLPIKLTNEVLVFNSVNDVLLPTVQMIGVNNPVIVYLQQYGVFAAYNKTNTSTWGNVWPNSEFFGSISSDNNGIIPFEGKVYIDVSTNIPYYWNGSELVALFGSLQEAINSKLNADLVGAENGVAPLDENKKIPSEYIPDDFESDVFLTKVVETASAIPSNTLGVYFAKDTNLIYIVALVDGAITTTTENPSTGKLYIDKNDNVMYRYDETNGLTAVTSKSAPASIFNATVEVPISGYYVLCDPDNEGASAVHAAWNANKAVSGLIISFEMSAGNWKTYQYVGKTVTEKNWINTDNWKDFGSLAAGSESYIIIDTIVGSPTVGTYYTLATAVQALITYQETSGITYAKKGLIISYKTAENTMETKQFQGEVSDFGEVGLWKDFGGGGVDDLADDPKKDGEEAFSTGGAYTHIPADLQINTEDEGVVKIALVNADKEVIGDEHQFTVGTGSGESSGTIVSITPKDSPLYASAGSDVILKAAIQSITKQGSNEQTNLIEKVELYDRTTNQLLETFKLNQASSANASTFDFSFDLSSYFTQASSRQFKLVAYDDTDHNGSRNVNVTAVDVTVQSEQTLNYTASTIVQVGGSIKTLPMYKFPNNASSEGILCTVEIKIDDEWKTLGTATISDTYSHSVTINPNNCCGSVLKHGAYALRIHGVDKASGVEGNYLHTAIMVIDSESTEPIVVTRWYSDDETAVLKQYENVEMDYAAWSPSASQIDVEVVETTTGEEEIKATTKAFRSTTYKYTQRVQNYDTDGSTTIKLAVRSSNVTSQVADFVVNGSLLDIEPVTTQLMFDMDMSGRSNDDADKTVKDNGYTLELIGANYSTNGFVKDSFGTSSYGTDSDTGIMALRIAENVTGKLSYAPFDNAAIETNGLAIQFRIMAKHIADDTARLISCISNGVGFYVTGKEVVFTTDNAQTVAHTITSALQEGSLTDVAIVIEPTSQAPYSGIGVVKMYFDGELIGACYYDSGTINRHSTLITFDGTYGDLYLYNIRAWETYYSFEQSFDNYLLKLNDTDTMIQEYNFNNGVMASQSAEGKPATNRPQASALYDINMPYFVLCKNANTDDTTDQYPDYLETLDGDKKTTRVLDLYAYFPDRPWQDFKATGVTVSNQGTTSSRRPIKNIKVKLKKGTNPTVTLLRDRSEFTSDEELAKYDECAKNAAKNRVQPKEGSVPTNIITVKVDYSESGGANNGASTQMFNELQRALGSNYMTPAQNAYTGKYELNTSIDSVPIAFYRTDANSSDATSPSYGYFHAKGNWNDDKGDAAVFGFEGVDGYNADCLNYGDFIEVIAERNQTLAQLYAATDTSAWDTEQVYVLSEFCGPNHKVYRYQNGAWTETTGTMTYSGGKWIVTGDVVNPVECYELLVYNGMDWFQGVNSVDDMLATDASGNPAWLTYYESRYPDDDDLNAAYEDGRKVPYTLYKWLKWCQACNQNLTADDGNITIDGMTGSQTGTPAHRLLKFKRELHNEANVYSMICYHLFTDYIAAVDQRSKNMMVGFYLDTDGKTRMYLNHLYDGDTILGSDNDCGLTIPAELDPNNDTNGFYQGHDSVLFTQLAASDYIWLQDYTGSGDTSDTTKTTTVASICATMRAVELSTGLKPFSKEGITKYWITDRLSKWPKLVSSYDGIRKYITASKSSANYFYALHGLSIQRLKDYVATRFRYRDGFYGTGDIFSSTIGMRCTGKNMTIKITAAKDGFFGIGVDRANEMHESAYLKAGESTTLHSDNTNTGSGVMLYIFGADRIAELYVTNATPQQQSWDISELTLVKKLVIGGEGYTPAESAQPLLSTLTLGQLPFLEELDIRNFPITSVDATYCPRLKSIQASGSKLQTLTLAQTCPIDTLDLPATMTSLSFKNLPNLIYPNGGLTVEGFSAVTTLQLSGCDRIEAATLLNDIIDGGAKIAQVSLVNLDVNADTTVLDALKASGAIGIGTDDKTVCDGLSGRWILTKFITESELTALQKYFPALEIHNAQYTMFKFDDTMSDPYNITNMENGTTGAIGSKKFTPSSHILAIREKMKAVRGKLNTTTGKWEGVYLSDENYRKLADGSDWDYTDGSGFNYDVFMLMPHCWYKGINDFKNNLKYICWSSLDDEPISSARNIFRSKLSDLIFKSNSYINSASVTVDSSTIDDASIFTTNVSCNVYKMNVKDMKQVRWPAINSASVGGTVFTDENGLIISNYNLAVSNSDFVLGEYAFIDVPSGAAYFYFTSANTNESEECIAVDSSEVEAIEPDWVEWEACLGGVYGASVDSMVQLRSISGATIKTGDGTQTTSVEWGYDDDGYPTSAPLSTMHYTAKDFQNLAYMRGAGYQLFDYEMSKFSAILWYCLNGMRDEQLLVGYGKGAGGQTGYRDTIGNSDSVLGSGEGNKILGFEGFVACTYEYMDNVAVNVESYQAARKRKFVENNSADVINNVWHVFDPISKTERTVTGVSTTSNPNGACISRVKWGKYCDMVPSQWVSDSKYATYYASGYWYSASRCRIIGRAGSAGFALGGLGYVDSGYGFSVSYSSLGVRLAFRGQLDITE